MDYKIYNRGIISIVMSMSTDECDDGQHCVTMELCQAYRDALTEKIKSLTRTIQLTGLAVTTIIIIADAIVRWLQYGR